MVAATARVLRGRLGRNCCCRSLFYSSGGPGRTPNSLMIGGDHADLGGMVGRRRPSVCSPQPGSRLPIGRGDRRDHALRDRAVRG